MSDTLDASKLKVAELKAELQVRGLDTKGNKALLVERLREALERTDDNDDEGTGARDFELESDHDEQEEEEEEDLDSVHELEPEPELKREAEHDNKPGVKLEPEDELELEPDHHSEQKPTSLPREDERYQTGVSSCSLPHKDVQSLEVDFDFSHRHQARDNTAVKEAEDKYDKKGSEDAPMEDMSEVKPELGNGYDGSLKSEEVDIKEESIEPEQKPSNKEDRQGGKRRAHFQSCSPDSKPKKPRLKVEEEVIVEDEPEYDKSAVLLDWRKYSSCYHCI
ncbi:uncharacterized protein LOC135204505 [Macrobrachium nipponense]|uniref:uncharacterized protein LOC135204505 n=1 Tax=Macrobrachium nipponense TaxID=159736 RepID=UPI0030C8B013